MAHLGPSRRHGWIPQVQVIPENGLYSFGDLLGTAPKSVGGHCRFQDSSPPPHSRPSVEWVVPQATASDSVG